MNLKKSDKSSFWHGHIVRYRASGQTRVDYCRKHKLKLHQLAYYVYQRNKSPVTNSDIFAQVTPIEMAKSTVQPGARLLVGSGMAIEFTSCTDPVWVARLVAAVGARS